MVTVLFAMISVLAVICFLGGIYALVKGATDGPRPSAVPTHDRPGITTTAVTTDQSRQPARVTEVRYAFVAGIVLLFLDLLLVWTTGNH
ncbi:hypothetical protein [Angustibacter aerolatus]|uniref:Uncharacterized protein n=1 Tax=Angustibacter aerolatus TaxID=1162965 RepID=A0ABQ6J9N3_9ACTN|nr:hypothetical protein [Angustibacter aerolatus]GMA84896.1 hypothetical protein GCM10025868_01460 [Angustibacter aerolatus]